MSNFTAERNNYRRKLIMLVKQHPILWNKTQENYNRNRPQKILAWHQISEQMDISVEKLRRTWENLRDQYRRDLKREVRFGFMSKWRFFPDMDFIRAMVSCKDNEYKENEFTDSDSDVDVTDIQLTNIQCSPITTTLVPPTTIQTITTPLSSTIPPVNSTCSTNMLPFQPIVLSRQWQTLANDIPQTFNGPTTPLYCSPNVPPSTDRLVLPQNCDSSKDYTPTINDSLTNENIAKQEIDGDLELDNAPATVVQQDCTLSKDNLSFTEFQEPCVSTSCHKRPCTSIEEILDAPVPTTTRSQTTTETDLNVKDDDYYFVMSLLPSLRQIPKNRKFPLRIGIMSLIAKDLEDVCKD